MLALKTTAPLVNQKIQDETGLTITQRTVGEGLGTRPECARKDASSHIAMGSVHQMCACRFVASGDAESVCWGIETAQNASSVRAPRRAERDSRLANMVSDSCATSSAQI